MEAILIGACQVTGDAIAQVVRRHEAGGSGPRWLLWRSGNGGTTEITVTTIANLSRKCELRLERGRPEIQSLITFTIVEAGLLRLRGNVYGEKNKYSHHNPADF